MQVDNHPVKEQPNAPLTSPVEGHHVEEQPDAPLTSPVEGVLSSHSLMSYTHRWDVSKHTVISFFFFFFLKKKKKKLKEFFFCFPLNSLMLTVFMF
jgi:hypothetical protein